MSKLRMREVNGEKETKKREGGLVCSVRGYKRRLGSPISIFAPQPAHALPSHTAALYAFYVSTESNKEKSSVLALCIAAALFIFIDFISVIYAFRQLFRSHGTALHLYLLD